MGRLRVGGIVLGGLTWLLAGTTAPGQVASQSLEEPPVSASGQPIEVVGPGRYAGRVRAAGYLWWYHVHVPQTYDGTQALPLVVLLHGSGGSGRGYLDGAGWAQLAEREEFLVVAPDGLAARPGLEPNFLLNPRLWNSGQHDSLTPRSRVDDVALFDALLATVGRRWRIDPRRVYVTGHSNGAALAYRLASARADRIAAIAPVAGLCWEAEPKPARPVPTLFLTGTRDAILPFEGGLSVLPWGARTSPPVPTALAHWAKALGCATEPLVSRAHPGVVVEDFAPRSNLDEVRLRAIFIEGQGHGWPGSKVPLMGRVFLGPSVPTVDATDLIWRFFRRYHLPGTERGHEVATTNRPAGSVPPAGDSSRRTPRDPWRAPASRMARSQPGSAEH